VANYCPVCGAPGTSSLQHFEENLGAAGLELEPEELERLDGLAAPAGDRRR
jgi:aryl-alcohol dehydrogenase-like predicted oxidoreductase